ncbi:TnsA endonuclease C-terminal domain-containing protein [Paraburkholderia caribensis]|uniref:TnsA endonuclease C-terminal domain-containing protein n=1 Tax=Paraburkholderia TaxID=1822464 RepID=UPI001CB5F75C|nr:TnsA endonuclease C-terminal domain-containing protein [Paraburkholderia caribensis]BEU25798.1 TnsA endonuclease N-terminal domain-containing protein [Paraburkholderia sp. 22B1P]CAG9250924.1 Transcriptional antiterminator [Paraburkholderia caribensis]
MNKREGADAPSFDYSRPGVRMDVRASRGRVHRLSAVRFGDEFVYLASDTELAPYLWGYFHVNILHLATQVDCCPIQTGRIADELGIRHPLDRDKGQSMISTDIVATFMMDDGERIHAINVKPPTFNAEQSRFRRLCSIEARYHHERGAGWFLSRSRGLNTNWSRNLWWLHPTAEAFYRSGFTQREEEIQAVFLKRLASPRGAATIRDICRYMHETGAARAGEPVRAYRQLLATRKIWTDMNVADLTAASPYALSVKRRGAK